MYDALAAFEALDRGERPAHTALDIARDLRDTHPDFSHIFKNGGCYRFHKLVSCVFPEAEAYYDPIEGHVYTLIDGRFFDISGERVEGTDILLPIEDALPSNADPEQWSKDAFWRCEESSTQPPAEEDINSRRDRTHV